MSDSLSVSDSVTAQLMLSSVSAGQPRLVLARLLRRDSGGWRLLEAARPGHAELWSVSEQGHLVRGQPHVPPWWKMRAGCLIPPGSKRSIPR